MSIAGDVGHDDVIGAVERALVDLPEGDGRVPRSQPDGMGPGRRIHDDTEQVHLVVGGRAVARDDPDREALDVVNHVLGGGCRAGSSTRSVSAAASPTASTRRPRTTPTPGCGPSTPAPSRRTSTPCARLINDELDRLVTDGITDEELAVAVGYLTGAYEMGLEDTGARMSGSAACSSRGAR